MLVAGGQLSVVGVAQKQNSQQHSVTLSNKTTDR